MLVTSVMSDSATLRTVVHQVPVCGILQARIMEWVVISSCRGSFWHRNWIHVSHTLESASGFFTTNAIRVRPQLVRAWLATVCEVARVGHNWTSEHACYWRELGQITSLLEAPVFLSHGRKLLHTPRPQPRESLQRPRSRHSQVSLSSTKYTWVCPWLSPLTLVSPDRATSMGSPYMNIQFSSVQSLSRVQLFVIPWITARQASLSITNSRSSPKLMSIESVMPSNNLILCCPLLLMPPIPPSIRVFSNESTLHMRWPKYWRFSLSISPSNEHPGLISFRMDWLDLLAVQGTLQSSPTPQFKSINFSVLSLLHSPTLTSTIHDHYKNHSLDSNIWILLSLKKQWNSDSCYKWTSFENVMLSEINPP